MASLRARLKSITGSLSERSLTLFCLLLIALLGAGLRFYNLGEKSLVPDEIYTATFSANGLGYVWQNSRGNPILYLITHFVLLLGNNEFILRMPSALEGILAIVVLYKMGKTIYGRKEGLVAALLLSLSAYHLRYSQNLRFYPMLVLISLLTLLLLWKALEEGKRRFWLGFLLATAANLYNHIFAWFVLASEMIFAADVILSKHVFSPNSRGHPLSTRVRGALKPLLGLIVLLALVVVLYLPAISPFTAGFFSQKFALKKFVSPETEIYPGRALTWETLSVSFFADSIFGPFGAGGGWPLIIYGGASILGLITSRPRQSLLALFWIGLPLVVLPTIGVRLFNPRYVIYMLPVYLLLISRGLMALGEIFTRLIEYFGRSSNTVKALQSGLMVGLFATLNLAPILQHYRAQGVDWQEIASYLMTNIESGDWILCVGEGYEAGGAVHCRSGLTHYLEEDFRHRHTLATDRDIGQRIAGAATENYGIWIAIRHTAPLNPDVVQRLQAEGVLTSFHYTTVIRVDQEKSLVENAVTALETLIKLHPRPEARFDLYLSLAEIYAQQGNLERAQQSLAAAREVQPHYYAARARLEKISGRIQRFQADYQLYLGDAYLADGRAQEAAREYERALALQPELDKRTFFHRVLGDAYLASGRAQESAQEYERALALQPELDKTTFFHRVLGDAYLASGRAQEAAQEYEIALALQPELDQRVWFHLRLGKAYQEAGCREEAIREYERVLELKPDNVAAQRALDALSQ